MIVPAGTREVQFRLLLYPGVKVFPVIAIPTRGVSDLDHRDPTGDQGVETALAHAEIGGGGAAGEQARCHGALR